LKLGEELPSAVIMFACNLIDPEADICKCRSWI